MIILIVAVVVVAVSLLGHSETSTGRGGGCSDLLDEVLDRSLATEEHRADRR